MSLKGDLRTMPLPDVLQWVASGRKTGTLHVERRSVEKRIILKEGALFSSWSNDPREQLGQFLIRMRLVSEEQLFRALLAQEERGQLLGSILVQGGVLAEADLKRALKTKAEEMVYDLFLWPAGQFEFREGELPEKILITFESPVTPAILEGIRRVDEWQRIREIFPNLQTTFRAAAPLKGEAPPLEREVVALAGAGRNLTEMGLELRRSEFETAALVFDLYTRGLLAVEQVHPTIPAEPVAAIRSLLALACERLKQRRYDAALEAYEEVLALDRLNLHAKKGLLAVGEARRRERPAKAVPRERVPALAVDLATLTTQNLDPQEGFVLSRVNGEWDVQSILKVCPMAEEETLIIFSRLLERGLIELR